MFERQINQEQRTIHVSFLILIWTTKPDHTRGLRKKNEQHWKNNNKINNNIIKINNNNSNTNNKKKSKQTNKQVNKQPTKKEKNNRNLWFNQGESDKNGW